MADGAGPTHWAVLVGINYYPGDRCRQGCVRDIAEVEQAMRGLISRIPINVQTFTGTPPPDGSRRRQPLEEPTAWPTYDDVIGALKEVNRMSRRGDSVYIHFSGHGMRLPDGQMALVLYEDHPVTPCASFPGRHLSSMLQILSTKGVFVTLVLGCCFSGRILRDSDPQDDGGGRVRFMDYDAALDARAELLDIDSDPDSLCVQVDDDDDDDDHNTVRNASIRSQDWLVNPKGYTVFTATGPHETAWEIKLNQDCGSGTTQRGALSYFLASALTSAESRARLPTHGILYERFLALFRAHWPRQTPMCYGNRDVGCFGGDWDHHSMASTRIIPAFRTADGQLCLAAGQAHGVQTGDEYMAYSPGASPGPSSHPDMSSRSEPPIALRVEESWPLVSRLGEVAQRSQSDQTLLSVDIGWKAVLNAASASSACVVGLIGDANDLIPHLNSVGQHHHHLRNPYLKPVSIDYSDLLEEATPQTCSFYVKVNSQSEYEILDGSRETIRNLPRVPRHHHTHPAAHSTRDTILGILGHLTKFKYLEAIENPAPDPDFVRSFSIACEPAPTTPLQVVPPRPGVSLPRSTNQEFEIRHQEDWGFTITNLGTSALYVAVLSFGPSWQIVDLHWTHSRADSSWFQPAATEILAKTSFT